MPNVLGIEIGGTKLQLTVSDEQANPLKTFRFSVDRNAGAKGIRDRIENVLADTSDFDIKKIGVGFGGPVDKKTGRIFTSYHIDGWSGFSIRDWLAQVSSCEVIVDNDANVAALGEALYGAGKNFSHVFYVTLGSGVGSGLVVNKKIYIGSSGAETEFGHIRLDKTGVTIQDACSGWAVNEKIRKASDRNPKSLLAQIAKRYEGEEAKALIEAMRQGDEDASIIFDKTIDDLAFGLSHATHLFNPSTIILGGGLSLIGEPIRKAVEVNIKKYLMDAIQPGPVIQLSMLKENAVPLGAIALALSH